MNSHVLLAKLIDIERSIGVETETVLRMKVIDAQVCLLSLHKELAEVLSKKANRFASEEPEHCPDCAWLRIRGR